MNDWRLLHNSGTVVPSDVAGCKLQQKFYFMWPATSRLGSSGSRVHVGTATVVGDEESQPGPMDPCVVAHNPHIMISF